VIAAVVLAVAGATGLLVEHLHARQLRDLEWVQASELNRAQLLPRSPGRAARALLAAVADGDPTVCATVLAPAAADQFAASVGAPDCAAAVRLLAARVVDPRRYPAPDSDAIPEARSPDGEHGTADLCRMTWNALARIGVPTRTPDPLPGPQLARLDLVRVLDQGYRIARFTPC
jgi:hypothetical protein